MLFKKVFSKKIRGINQYVSSVVGIGSILLFFMFMVYAYSEIAKEEEIHRIHRKYLLSMEREGYLTPAYETALINELTAFGATNIDLTGTSRSEVGYGNRVILSIQCDLQVDRISMATGNAVAGKVSRHVVVEKDGTALY